VIVLGLGDWPSRLVASFFLEASEVKELEPHRSTDRFLSLVPRGRCAEVLRDISPIEDFTGQLEARTTDHVFDPPKHSEDECASAP
jgi:hypothetical protein